MAAQLAASQEGLSSMSERQSPMCIIKMGVQRSYLLEIFLLSEGITGHINH
jgi:hypothetical protein